jgi:hypothetical protein
MDKENQRWVGSSHGAHRGGGGVASGPPGDDIGAVCGTRTRLAKLPRDASLNSFKNRRDDCGGGEAVDSLVVVVDEVSSGGGGSSWH